MTDIFFFCTWKLCRLSRQSKYREGKAYGVSRTQSNFLKILEHKIQRQRFRFEQNLLTVFRVLVNRSDKNNVEV